MLKTFVTEHLRKYYKGVLMLGCNISAGWKKARDET